MPTSGTTSGHPEYAPFLLYLRVISFEDLFRKQTHVSLRAKTRMILGSVERWFSVLLVP
jgi:hypothetical protein